MTATATKPKPASKKKAAKATAAKKATPPKTEAPAKPKEPKSKPLTAARAFSAIADMRVNEAQAQALEHKIEAKSEELKQLKAAHASCISRLRTEIREVTQGKLYDGMAGEQPIANGTPPAKAPTAGDAKPADAKANGTHAAEKKPVPASNPPRFEMSDRDPGDEA